jgi:outer membrane protein
MWSRSLLLSFLFLPIIHAPCLAQSVQTLSLADAEKLAIQNHPQIQIATSLAAAAGARVQQARSAYYPQAYGSLTGVDSENNSRIAAGGLNNPIIYERYSNGVTVGQLLTDFGRTHELVKSSSYHAQARQEDVAATRANVLLQVDQAYFAALKAQTVLRVAEKTVKTRQLVADQVSTLAKNKLKSGLDVSFANVDLSQAQLLLVQAQNDLQASFADLSASLGYAEQKIFQLVDEPFPAAPSADLPLLLHQALQNRPELLSQQLDVNSAKSYATAERDLWFPTITAVGTAGLTLYGADQLAPRYAAAGFNVNVPLFNGHLYGALRSEADSQAQAQQQYLRDLQNRVVRDVQKAWLNSNSAFQRMSLTDELLKSATQALDLAQERYKLGLSSIIELSQAQLNETQAEIAQAGAKYDYEAQLSALNYQIGRTP